MRISASYNPFSPVTKTMLQSCLSSGEIYWVVQRFLWPGTAIGKGFIVSRYNNENDAQQHCRQLSVREGKIVDISQDAGKIENLIREGSGYHVFMNTFQHKDWQKRLKSAYKVKFISFLRKRIKLSGGQPVDVDLHFEFGRLVAEIHAGETEPFKVPIDQIINE